MHRTTAPLILGLVTCLACASTDGGGTAAEISFPTATFEEVVMGAVAAGDAIDAALVDAANPSPARAELVLMCDWRRPTPESAVLRVEVAVADDGVRVAVAGEVVARGNRARSRDPDSPEARAACSACPRPMRADEAFVEVSNTRALRNVRSSVAAYLVALEAALGGLESVRG